MSEAMTEEKQTLVSDLAAAHATVRSHSRTIVACQKTVLQLHALWQEQLAAKNFEFADRLRVIWMELDLKAVWVTREKHDDGSETMKLNYSGIPLDADGGYLGVSPELSAT